MVCCQTQILGLPLSHYRKETGRAYPLIHGSKRMSMVGFMHAVCVCVCACVICVNRGHTPENPLYNRGNSSHWG